MSGLEGLCLLMRRLAYPCRYDDLVKMFARPVPELCMISNTMVDWIYDNHSFRLTSWDQFFLSPYLEQYCQSIAEKRSPLKNCFGFIHGTWHAIARPDTNHRTVYNGHKRRVHALTFQAVALPNGRIGNLYGPVEGCSHDAAMLQESHLLNVLERNAHTQAGDILCLYGDPACPLRPQLIGPYREGDFPFLTKQ